MKVENGIIILGSGEKLIQKKEEKIIFLDIDGPMAPGRTYFMADDFQKHILGGQRLDPVAVRMINRLCFECDAKVVISSVWRMMPFKLFAALGLAGFDDFHLHNDWKTKLPIDDRSMRISEWLAEDGHENVTKYVCVDDEDIKGHPLVQVDFEDGFLLQHYREVEEILGKERDIHKKDE